MRKTLTSLLIASSLLGATALTACGGDDDASTPAAAAAATPAHTASHESAPDRASKADAPDAKPAGPVSADISGFAFSPANLEVEVGQKITWTNSDAAPHTVTATSGAQFDSGTLEQGANYTWKATKAGTIEYVCEIHPSMVGTITVKAP